MESKIKECQMIAELLVLESQNVLNELEECLVFERKMEIFLRIKKWHLENEQLGIVPDLTDTWTPEQRQRFLCDWQDEELPMRMNRCEKRSYEETSSDDEEPQVGCGQKRSYEETSNDDNESGQDDGAARSNVFTVQSVKQVNVKKFKTTGVDYSLLCGLFRIS